MLNTNLPHQRRICAFFALLALGCPATAEEKNDEGSKAPVVKLLDAGAEPRRELRYQFQAEKTSTMVMEMKMSMTMQLDDLEGPSSSVPTMVTQMEITPGKVTPDGSLHYTFNLVKSGLAEDQETPGELKARLENELQSLVGMTGSATVTSRGFTEEAEINLPENAPRSVAQMTQSMQQSIRQMSTPLPAEPVGIGAKWQVENQVKSNEIDLTQTTTATLVAMDEQTCKVKVTIQQTAKEQQIQSPGLPQGAALTLKSLESKGDGEMDIDLREIVPDSHVDMASTTVMQVDQNAQQRMMTMKMKLGIQIHPGKE